MTSEQQARDAERDAIVAWLRSAAKAIERMGTEIGMKDNPVFQSSIETYVNAADGIQSNEHRKAGEQT